VVIVLSSTSPVVSLQVLQCDTGLCEGLVYQISDGAVNCCLFSVLQYRLQVDKSTTQYQYCPIPAPTTQYPSTGIVHILAIIYYSAGCYQLWADDIINDRN